MNNITKSDEELYLERKKIAEDFYKKAKTGKRCVMIVKKDFDDINSVSKDYYNPS